MPDLGAGRRSPEFLCFGDAAAKDSLGALDTQLNSVRAKKWGFIPLKGSPQACRFWGFFPLSDLEYLGCHLGSPVPGSSLVSGTEHPLKETQGSPS